MLTCNVSPQPPLKPTLNTNCSYSQSHSSACRALTKLCPAAGCSSSLLRLPPAGQRGNCRWRVLTSPEKGHKHQGAKRSRLHESRAASGKNSVQGHFFTLVKSQCVCLYLIVLYDCNLYDVVKHCCMWMIGVDVFKLLNKN